MALANFLIEPSSPLAISRAGEPTSGWGLLLEHSMKSEFSYSVSHEAEDGGEKNFLNAAQKLIAWKLSKHSLLNEESKEEGLKNLSKLFATIWVSEKVFERKLEFSNALVCYSHNFLS